MNATRGSVSFSLFPGGRCVSRPPLLRVADGGTLNHRWPVALRPLSSAARGARGGWIGPIPYTPRPSCRCYRRVCRHGPIRAKTASAMPTSNDPATAFPLKPGFSVFSPSRPGGGFWCQIDPLDMQAQLKGVVTWWIRFGHNQNQAATKLALTIRNRTAGRVLRCTLISANDRRPRRFA